MSVLNAQSDWRPRLDEIDSPLPNALWLFDSRLVHCLQTLTSERMTECIKLDGASCEAAAGALRSYERMRTAALLCDVVPEPGYRAGFLEFVDQSLRVRVAAIFDEHFTREPSCAHIDSVRRSIALADWIRAPLARPELDRRRRGQGWASVAGSPRPSRSRASTRIARVADAISRASRS